MKRKGFTLIELLVVVAIIALLISILLPSLSRARELAKRAVCASNQRGIGQGLHIYANDNKEWFPVHMFRTGDMGTGAQQAMSVDSFTYVGSMGFEYYKPVIATEPLTNSSHASRSLFLLIVGGQSTAGSFICPSANDTEDDMRNRGDYAQAGTGSEDEAARAGVTRFDFAGYTTLSYAYQVPFGRRARPRENMDTRMPIGADKSPYFMQGDAIEDTGAFEDARSPVDPPLAEWSSLEPYEIIRKSNEEWRMYNSYNHNAEGQNILFVDGHADFARKPIEGVNNDNIYTAFGGSGLDQLYEEQVYSLIGAVGTENDSVVPLVQSDSYLIP